jgi:hypothetical protein
VETQKEGEVSNIILPGGSEKKAVVGRRLKSTEALVDLCGQRLFLRNPQGVSGIPVMRSGYVGIICGVGPDPAYPKRSTGVGVLSPMGGAPFAMLPTQVLELADPWCSPPGFPEKQTSLLEE